MIESDVNPKYEADTSSPMLEPQSHATTQQSFHIPVSLLLTLALLGMIASLGTDIFTPSFPEVAAQLHTDEATVQLTLTVFMVGMGLGQLCIGAVSDRWGRRGPLMLSCVLFVLASAAAPLSTSIGMLIAARLIQGFFGAAGAVLGRAIARDVARGQTLAQVLSLLGVFTSLSPIAAPIMGGVLAEPIGWRGVLWVLTGIGVLMLVCSFLFVPESLPPERRQTTSAQAVGRSVMDVLRDRSYLGYTLVQCFGVGTLYAFIAGSSFVLQNEYGLRPLTYSLVFALNALALIIGGLCSTWLVKHVALRRMLVHFLIASLALNAILVVLSIALDRPPLVPLMILIWIISLCNAPIMATTTTLALDRHPHNAGMASALLGALTNLVSGIIAALVSITGTTTVISMTVVMGLSVLAAALSYIFLCRGESPAIPEVIDVGKDPNNRR